MKKSVVHKVSKITLIITAALTVNALAHASVATNPAGEGPGIAIGTSSVAASDTSLSLGTSANTGSADGSIAIGNKANINNLGNPSSTPESVKKGLPDIAIGEEALVYGGSARGGAIAIGPKAYVEFIIGLAENSLDFKQTSYTGFFHPEPVDPSKAPGGIAIGAHAYARSGTTAVGVQNYKGSIGDITIDTTQTATSGGTRDHQLGLFNTSIGTNALTNGTLSTVVGANSIITTKYTGGSTSSWKQGLGANILGALNSIENKTVGEEFSGLATSVIGLANRTSNSNGALIFGAGNEITNSYEKANSFAIGSASNRYISEYASDIRNAVQKGTLGGQTFIVGGGNTADNTKRVGMLGSSNKLKFSEDNMVMGSRNHMDYGDKNFVVGNDHKLVGKEGKKLTNNIIIAFNNYEGKEDDERNVTHSNAIMIGANTWVKHDDGIALGSGSVSNVDKDVVGVELKKNSSGFSWSPSGTDNSTWKSSRAAVSIGDPSNNITRQITGVAAGTNDTDAVNVAQLKAVIDSVINNGGVGGAGGDHTTIIASKDVVDLSDQPTQSTGTTSSSPTASTEQSFTTDGYINVTPNASNTEEAKKKAQNYKIGVSKDTKKAVDNANAVIVNESSVVIDGQSKKITNIAEGKDDYDAVNVRQLNNATTTINNRINNLSHHVDRVDRHARAGIASAMAAGALPQAYLPGKSMIAGGVATYRSASAVAFGLSSVSDDGSRIYKLNASANTEGDAGVAAGVGFQW